MSLAATLLASSVGKAGPVDVLRPEIVLLGDSTSNSPVVGGPLGAQVYLHGDLLPYSEVGNRPGILSFAMAGHTTSLQLGLFQNSIYWGDPTIKVIIVQTGINDTPALPGYLTAIAAIKGGNPFAKLYTAETIPWSASNAASIAALNAAIIAGIPGADGAITSHFAILGGGNPGTLLPQYQFQGGPHDNYAGRIVNGAAYRTTMVALGLLEAKQVGSTTLATQAFISGGSAPALYTIPTALPTNITAAPPTYFALVAGANTIPCPSIASGYAVNGVQITPVNGGSTNAKLLKGISGDTGVPFTTIAVCGATAGGSFVINSTGAESIQLVWY
jgi:hypothetical protein